MDNVEDCETTTYIVHNADITPRQVVLEHPIRSGWKLLDDVKPEESSATLHRFRVGIEPGKTERFTVKERHLDVSSTYVSNLTDNELATYAHDGSIKPERAAQLRKVIGKRCKIFNLELGAKSVQQEMESIDKGQSRLRENMKVLKGSPEEKTPLQRYTKHLDSQEDRLAALQKQTADLKAKRAQLQSEMDDLVAKITFDEKL